MGNPPPDLVARIRTLLTASLAPTELTVLDDSATHAGHAGAREGGHYQVLVRSSRFQGLVPLARHRLVYDALAPLMGPGGIHALSIDARLPS
jgi:BolA protein